MIYLASPYSHPDPIIRGKRRDLAAALLSKVAHGGHVIYSPIVHWHDVAVEYNMPKDWGFWWEQNKAMLDLADQMWVYQINGWRESKGIKEEIKYARANNIRIYYARYRPGYERVRIRAEGSDGGSDHQGRTFPRF